MTFASPNTTIFAAKRETPGVPISSQESRAARGLLNWKLSDLAAASALGLSTVKHFEHSRRRTTLANLVAIRGAFENVGIVFESNGKVVGVLGLHIHQLRCKPGYPLPVPVKERAPRRHQPTRGALDV
jgi:hypothetical protein